MKVNTRSAKLLLGGSQGSVLGPLLFNTYFNNLFHLIERTGGCNYVDDITFMLAT